MYTDPLLPSSDYLLNPQNWKINENNTAADNQRNAISFD